VEFRVTPYDRGDAATRAFAWAAGRSSSVRHLGLLSVALLLTWAVAAAPLPADATAFVTDAEGTIVGIGRTLAGETFELRLLIGFDGPAQLIFVTAAGEVVVLRIMVVDGVAYVDRLDLRVLAFEAGFHDVRVVAAAALADGGAPDPRSTAGRGNADETGRGHAADPPGDRGRPGGGDDDEHAGPPAEFPGAPGGPPVDPADPPTEPPVDPPGRP